MRMRGVIFVAHVPGAGGREFTGVVVDQQLVRRRVGIDIVAERSKIHIGPDPISQLQGNQDRQCRDGSQRQRRWEPPELRPVNCGNQRVNAGAGQDRVVKIFQDSRIVSQIHRGNPSGGADQPKDPQQQFRLGSQASYGIDQNQHNGDVERKMGFLAEPFAAQILHREPDCAGKGVDDVARHILLQKIRSETRKSSHLILELPAPEDRSDKTGGGEGGDHVGSVSPAQTDQRIQPQHGHGTGGEIMRQHEGDERNRRAASRREFAPNSCIRTSASQQHRPSRINCG